MGPICVDGRSKERKPASARTWDNRAAPLSNSKGQVTQAVYIFTNMLRKLIQDELSVPIYFFGDLQE